MLIYVLYIEFLKNTVWEFQAENLAELIFMIIYTVLIGILGILVIPIDIFLSPVYLAYYLLSKIEL